MGFGTRSLRHISGQPEYGAKLPPGVPVLAAVLCHLLKDTPVSPASLGSGLTAALLEAGPPSRCSHTPTLGPLESVLRGLAHEPVSQDFVLLKISSSQKSLY